MMMAYHVKRKEERDDGDGTSAGSCLPWYGEHVSLARNMVYMGDRVFIFFSFF